MSAENQSSPRSHGDAEKGLQTSERTLPPAPRHPFEVRISIGGDDWDYVVRTFHKLAAHIEEHGPDCGMCSGGAGGCHSVDIQRREISVEAYRKELSDWFNALPKNTEPITNGQEPIAVSVQGENS